jgi:hypothetical protein
MKNNSPASSNFQVAKVLGILIVATAHFFPDTMLWVPSSVALFVFGFSSAYFTHLKYSQQFDAVPYWTNKVSRLGYSLLVINIFLLVVAFFASSRTIFVWQTLLHLVGLSGLLDWLHIGNASPLGNGMWFFTLLLIFYGVYPLLRMANRNALSSSLVLLIALAGMSYCHFHYPVGYDLWLTAFSFIFGVYIAGHPVHRSTPLYILGGVASVSLMGILNFLLKINDYNFFLNIATSALLTVWLCEAILPAWLLRPISYLSDIVLEIYLIHTYLFFVFTGSKFADYVLSMCVILFTAKLLQYSAIRIERFSEYVGWGA